MVKCTNRVRNPFHEVHPAHSKDGRRSPRRARRVSGSVVHDQVEQPRFKGAVSASGSEIENASCSIRQADHPPTPRTPARPESASATRRPRQAASLRRARRFPRSVGRPLPLPASAVRGGVHDGRIHELILRRLEQRSKRSGNVSLLPRNTENPGQWHTETRWPEWSLTTHPDSGRSWS
jgi:hypothetical protein